MFYRVTKIDFDAERYDEILAAHVRLDDRRSTRPSPVPLTRRW